MSGLDRLDRELLGLLQNQFPLSETPYLDLAARLGLTEAEVLARVEALRQKGIIRRIGAILDARMMGYHSTLCACQVEPADVERVAAVINAMTGVTHNYQRAHRYNIWFTLTAPSDEDIERSLQELQRQTGVKAVAMPATRLYKIDARFEMSGDDDS